MMETAKRWWRSVPGFTPWFVVHALLPGAALFALLLWLSHRFLNEGFAQVRQYAFLPFASKLSLAASEQRNWWSCTCVGARTCLAELTGGLRRCCMKFLREPLFAATLHNAA
jgi:hypothetical protein